MTVKQLLGRFKLSVGRKGIIYLGVGAAAFCFEYFSFLLIFNHWGALLVAQTVSFCLGLIISFAGNRAYTFSKGDFHNSVKKQILSYLMLALINIIFTNVAIYTLVGLGVHPFISKVVVMGMVVVWNFIIFNKVIFRSKNSTAI